MPTGERGHKVLNIMIVDQDCAKASKLLEKIYDSMERRGLFGIGAIATIPYFGVSSPITTESVLIFGFELGSSEADAVKQSIEMKCGEINVEIISSKCVTISKERYWAGHLVVAAQQEERIDCLVNQLKGRLKRPFTTFDVEQYLIPPYKISYPDSYVEVVVSPDGKKYVHDIMETLREVGYPMEYVFGKFIRGFISAGDME
jgi:hypothetical protein